MAGEARPQASTEVPIPLPHPAHLQGDGGQRRAPPHTSPPDSKTLRFPLQCDTFPAAVTPHRRSRWRGVAPGVSRALPTGTDACQFY